MVDTNNTPHQSTNEIACVRLLLVVAMHSMRAGRWDDVATTPKRHYFNVKARLVWFLRNLL